MHNFIDQILRDVRNPIVAMNPVEANPVAAAPPRPHDITRLGLHLSPGGHFIVVNWS